VHLQTENVFDTANGIKKQRSASGLASPGASAPYGVYQTKTDFITLSDVSLKALAEAIDEPALLDFTEAEALTRRDEVRVLVARRMLDRTAEEWLEHLLAAGIWCGPVKDYEALLSDPQFIHAKLLFETQHPRLGTLRNIRSPITLSEAPAERQPRQVAPELGQHTSEILAGLGLTAEDVARLKAAGTI